MNYQEFKSVFDPAVMSEVSSQEELSKRLGIPRQSLSLWLHKMGLAPEKKGRGSLETKLGRKSLFLGTPSAVESYFYGFYLGDGCTVYSRGKVLGFELYCCDSRDKGDFIEDVRKLGFDCVDSPKGAQVSVTGAFAKQFEDKGFLHRAKTRLKPDLPEEVVDYFDMFLVLRGLLDADGSFRWNKTLASFEICGVWKSLLDLIGVWLEKNDVRFHLGVTKRSGNWSDLYRLKVSTEGCIRLCSLGLFDREPDLGFKRKTGRLRELWESLKSS